MDVKIEKPKGIKGMKPKYWVYVSYKHLKQPTNSRL